MSVKVWQIYKIGLFSYKNNRNRLMQIEYLPITRFFLLISWTPSSEDPLIKSTCTFSHHIFTSLSVLSGKAISWSHQSASQLTKSQGDNIYSSALLSSLFSISSSVFCPVCLLSQIYFYKTLISMLTGKISQKINWMEYIQVHHRPHSSFSTGAAIWITTWITE